MKPRYRALGLSTRLTVGKELPRAQTATLGILIVALLMVHLLRPTPSLAQSQMFVTETGKLWKSRVDGQNPRILLSGVVRPTDIAIDEANGKIYWSDWGKISRANFDGSATEEIVTKGDDFYSAGGVVVYGGHLYWIEHNSGVRRANLDGTNIVHIISGLSNYPAALAIGSGKIYWSEWWGGGKIRRSNLDGSDIEDVLNNLGTVYDLEFDASGEYLYFGRLNDITRLKISDGTVQEVAHSIVNLGLDVDRSTGKIYWSQRNTGLLWSIDPDGSNRKVVLSGLTNPEPVEIHPGLGRLFFGSSFPGSLQSVRLGGSDLRTLKSDLPGGAEGITLDVENGRLFWADVNKRILKSDLNGQNVQTVITGDHLVRPMDVAIDRAEGKIYWVDRFEWHDGRESSGDQAIKRANLDGTNVQVLADRFDGLDEPRRIALDLVSRKMYWSDVRAHRIQRANFDGSAVEVLLDGQDGLRSPTGLDIDPIHRKIYWVESQRIREADLSGSNMRTVVSIPGCFFTDVAIEPTARKIYWTDLCTNSIRRANLDGLAIETVRTASPDVKGIALDPAPSLSAPVRNSNVTQHNVTLQWVGDPSLQLRYDVQVSTDAGFNNVIFRENTPNTDLPLPNLPIDRQLYWRVKRTYPGGSRIGGPWSETWSFRLTVAPGPVTLRHPANGGTALVATDLSWDELPSAERYHIMVDDNPSFSSQPPVLSDVVTGEAQFAERYSWKWFAPGVTLYWRIRAGNTFGDGPWSDTYHFTTADPVKQLAPVNGATGVSITPLFSWSNTMYGEGESTNYLYLDDDPQFRSPIVSDIRGSVTSPWGPVAPLEYGRRYYWYVLSQYRTSPLDTGPVSKVGSFTTISGPTASLPSRSEACYDGGGEWKMMAGETFEGAFPAAWNVWRIGDGAVHWGTSNRRAKSGVRSAWAAAEGKASGNATGVYPDETDTWMRLGPFDLRGLEDARFRFDRWVDAVSGDSLIWGASSDGIDFETIGVSGNETQWTRDGFSLSEPASQNFIGEPKVWIGFRFKSNDSGHREGPYVDNVCVERLPIAPSITLRPALLGPSDASTSIRTDATLSWSRVTGATYYTVEIASDIEFSHIVQSANIAQTSFNVQPGVLSRNETYFWRVRGRNRRHAGPWSEVWRFDTPKDAAFVPDLNTPAADATDVSTSIELTWSNAAYADRYDLQVASSPEMTDPILTLNTTISSATFVAPYCDEDFFWRVRAIGPGGTSNWSQTRKFTTGATGPLVSSDLSPVDSASGVGVSPTLTWIGGPEAETFRLEVARDEVFEDLVLDTTNLRESRFELDNLLHDATYYWRVAGVDESGKFTFTMPFRFTTVVAAPMAVGLSYPEDGDSGLPRNLALGWQELEVADGYQIQIHTDARFISPLILDSLVNQSPVQVSRPLVLATDYFWRVRAFNAGGNGPWSPIWKFTVAVGTATEELAEIPERYVLHPNYPNPFNPSTFIAFELPEQTMVSLTVLDVSGRLVRELVSETMAAGRYSVTFSAPGLASGMYFYKLETPEYMEVRSMSFVK